MFYSWTKEPRIWWLEELRGRYGLYFPENLLHYGGNNPPTLCSIAGPNEKRRQCVPALPARVVRWSPVSKATRGERAGGEEEDAASPFLCPQGSLTSTLTRHLNLKSFTVIAFVEDSATPRVCCIYSAPRKVTVLDRESAPQHNPTTGKNDAWWLKSPHQMTSHKRIWWLEGQSWLADFP